MAHAHNLEFNRVAAFMPAAGLRCLGVRLGRAEISLAVALYTNENYSYLSIHIC